MSINVGKWIAGAAEGLINSLGENVDRFVETKEDKRKFKQAIQKQVKNFQLQMEQEISARHKADMNSDSWLSKNVRPLVLVYSLVLLTLLAFGDGNISWGEYTFTVKDSYVALLKQLLSAAVMFYFGSRGIEKLGNAWRQRKEHKDLTKNQKQEQDGDT